MNRARPTINSLLSRCVRLRCPSCGQASIIERPFHIKHHCPSCSVLFQREAGFFVGAIMVNVVTTEIMIIVIYLACLLFISSNYQLMLTILFVFALLFPVAFYHHSWSIWLSFDHLIEKLPRYVEQTSGQSPNGSNGQRRRGA